MLLGFNCKLRVQCIFRQYRIVQMSLRQRLAKQTPGLVRKAIRMGEHYVRRHVEWMGLLRDCTGRSLDDKILLGLSFLAAPITSLRRLDGFEPPLLLGDVELSVRDVGRFRIRAGTDDVIHIQPSREPHIVRQLHDFLRPGGLFVDAGANIGFYSVLAAKLVGSAGSVIAIEMVPETATRLRRHAADNACWAVEVFETALSDLVGQEITVNYDELKLGQASIVAGTDIANSRSISVTTSTLDEILGSVESVELMKMDLEGAEYIALSGSLLALKKISRLVFESNSVDERIFDLLTHAGFAVELLTGNDYVAYKKQVLE